MPVRPASWRTTRDRYNRITRDMEREAGHVSAAPVRRPKKPRMLTLQSDRDAVIEDRRSLKERQDAALQVWLATEYPSEDDEEDEYAASPAPSLAERQAHFRKIWGYSPPAQEYTTHRTKKGGEQLSFFNPSGAAWLPVAALAALLGWGIYERSKVA